MSRDTEDLTRVRVCSFLSPPSAWGTTSILHIIAIPLELRYELYAATCPVEDAAVQCSAFSALWLESVQYIRSPQRCWPAMAYPAGHSQCQRPADCSAGGEASTFLDARRLSPVCSEAVQLKHANHRP